MVRQIKSQTPSTRATAILNRAALPDKFDFEKKQANAEASNRALIYEQYHHLGAPVKVQFEGTLSTNGVNQAVWGEGKGKIVNYSLGVDIEGEEGLIECLGSMKEDLLSYLPEDERDAYSLTDVVKSNRLYLKLKLANSKKAFEVKSNVTLNPKKIETAKLSRGMRVKVQAEIGAYFQLSDKRAGITIKPVRLDFSEEEEVAEEEEEDADEVSDETPCPPAKKARVVKVVE